MTDTCTTCGRPADPHPYRHPITRLGQARLECGCLVECHGGHTIQITDGPPVVCLPASELEALRARVAELEAEVRTVRDIARGNSHAYAAARDERDRAEERVAELEAAQAEAKRIHDESPGECYHCPRCQDADEAGAAQREPIGYLPPITHDGRRLTPGDHMSISPTRPPEGVAVWSYGPPEAPGYLIGHAVAVDAGDGWFADTVNLDGSYSDADCRHHDWLSASGYRAMVVELREVSE